MGTEIEIPASRTNEHPRRRSPSPTGKVDRAQPGTEEGRYQVRPGTAPHPSGLRPATLSQERVFPPRPSRLRRATLSAGEGNLPAGDGSFTLSKQLIQRPKPVALLPPVGQQIS